MSKFSLAAKAFDKVKGMFSKGATGAVDDVAGGAKKGLSGFEKAGIVGTGLTTVAAGLGALGVSTAFKNNADIEEKKAEGEIELLSAAHKSDIAQLDSSLSGHQAFIQQWEGSFWAPILQPILDTVLEAFGQETISDRLEAAHDAIDGARTERRNIVSTHSAGQDALRSDQNLEQVWDKTINPSNSAEQGERQREWEKSGSNLDDQAGITTGYNQNVQPQGALSGMLRDVQSEVVGPRPVAANNAQYNFEMQG